MSTPEFTNRLIHETSPYLLQHAHNPVDWYPWGPEALAAAKREDRPIFLSIGYSACHWCHVMEHESFEDPDTAKVMNDLFINIKVDREERPDLDQIYMAATQLITQHGGWPMSVWLTPELQPFYAGTYFPPQPRHGLPAFVDICAHLGKAWKDRRDEVLSSAGEVTRIVNQMGRVAQEAETDEKRLWREGARELAGMVDRTYGGFGRAPKFPHITELRLLLRASRMFDSPDYQQLVELSLDHMIRGGIHDQLGGGFHRYSTDERWLVPHFEKMLYDNALIPLACLEAAQATTDENLRSTFLNAIDDTLGYVLREMTSADGAFFSAQDADSEGVEGKYFVWSREEVHSLLGKELAEVFCYAYDVTSAGNWEQANIPHLAKPLSQTAKLLSLTTEELVTKLDEAKAILLAARSRRIPPGTDHKVLTSWNAMMIDTLACVDGGRGGPYADAARRSAEYILGNMRTVEGLLLRTAKDGRAKLNAYLEDYAYLTNALISLYESTFEPRWIDEALALTDVMIDQFWDENEGGFFYTGKNHEQLIARGKDPQDGAIPSGNSMAATALARLAKLTGRSDLIEYLERTLRLFQSVMKRSAMASAQMMIASMLHREPSQEWAFIADPHAPETQAALRLLREHFLPGRVVALRRPSDTGVGAIKLLEGKTGDSGNLTVHLCQNFTCQAPTVGLEAFQNLLKNVSGS